MGEICTLLNERMGAKRSTLSNPSHWLTEWATGGESSSSGVQVSEASSLKYTPFWAAVRIISGTLASLPFKTYQRLAQGGKRPVSDHAIYRLLHDRPNDYMDAVTFIETRQSHVLTYGNGFAEIQRDGAGRPIALWPLLPNRTKRQIKNNIPYYEVRLPVDEPIYLPDYNVLHIKGLGFDGYTGYNVVQYHKEAIGYGVAVKRYGARFFANDASPGGVLEHPNVMSDSAFSHLKESWQSGHGGLENAHRMQILEEGVKWSKTGTDPAQAQALEVQKWTVDDCSRIFQIPPHKLGSMEFSKYNNVEQLAIDFVCTTMLYWFRKWEQEINYKLLMPSERGRLFCEILVDGLLRGDMKSRYEAYRIGRNAGFLCVDDIREKENMNPLPDGKGQIFLEPLNMKPAGSEPAASDDGAVRLAYRNWLAVQWRRIIEKQIKALSNGSNGNFYEHQKDYARKLLAEPLNGYATVRQLAPDRVHTILNAVLTDQINKDKTLHPGQAELLADRLIEQIGGDNALSQ